jgi:hypothetical protein
MSTSSMASSVTTLDTRQLASRVQDLKRSRQP